MRQAFGSILKKILWALFVVHMKEDVAATHLAPPLLMEFAPETDTRDRHARTKVKVNSPYDTSPTVKVPGSSSHTRN